jgi:hypothetical protein
MNSTDTDIEINIDVEDVHDLVTSDLNGEKIESLLYRSGYDSEHKVGDEGVSVLEISADSVTIIMSETWEADGMWYIDPSSIVLDVLVDGEFHRTFFPDDIAKENDLVEYIDNLIESVVL